eukprot:CAMPEP_0178602556 /NCGR_PEP_ID=MMETSP0697-20121206/35030_1 /TAXON_ID=265572 /ORGANISM="Extubocellulus spinifer, Strain CCMP396" /LENGTH=381 /DNA_ID=CAMNT_0020240781 /DNA_START=43 /DNA_END=1188 /DNA_ORIENTATION=+
MASESLTKHLVVPGQIIAISSADDPDGGFLRGHGTYVETVAGGEPTAATSTTNTASTNIQPDDTAEQQDGDTAANENSNSSNCNKRLVASVAGTVERVNKLISVIPLASSIYSGQVGDLIVGRISSVGPTRWKVSLTPSTKSGGGGSGGGSGIAREAQLPLSGVDLPGGVQRIRTAEDARGMRQLFAEGNLLSAEVQQVAQSDGTLMLHTRSLRYGKLENGVVMHVPPALVRRMRQHMCTLSNIGVDVLIGCNGGIWIQRSMPKVGGADSAGGGGSAASAAAGTSISTTAGAMDEDGAAPLADTLQKNRQRHAATAVLPDERENIVRVRNSVECLRLVHCYVTPDSIMKVYNEAVRLGVKVGDMMRPDIVLALTEPTRVQK